MSKFSLTLNYSTYQTVQMPNCNHCNRLKTFELMYLNYLVHLTYLPAQRTIYLTSNIWSKSRVITLQGTAKKQKTLTRQKKSLSGCCRFILLCNQRMEREIQSQLSLTSSILPRSKPSKFFNVKNGGKVNLWKRTNWVLDVLLRV